MTNNNFEDKPWKSLKIIEKSLHDLSSLSSPAWYSWASSFCKLGGSVQLRVSKEKTLPPHKTAAAKRTKKKNAKQKDVFTFKSFKSVWKHKRSV